MRGLSAIKARRNAPSLRGKLQRTTLVILVNALLLVTVALTYAQFAGSRNTAVENAEAVTDIISQNLGATVLFENRMAAGQVLQALSYKQGFAGAVIFLPGGEVFASHPEDGSALTEEARNGLSGERRQVDGSRLLLRQPIMAGDIAVAELVLVARLESFFQWFQSTALIVLPVLLVSIALSMVFARREVRSILSPLDVFRQAMRCVGEGKISGLYMPEIGDRELQPLVKGFNEMVAQIHEQQRLLSESELRYRRIVETQNEAICRLDKFFQMTFANAAFVKLVGYDRRMLLGQRPAALVPPEDCRHIEAAHGQLSPKNPSAPFACRLRAADGELRWVEATLQASFEADGRINEYLIVARDVSKQKVAEQMAIQASKLATLGEISTSIAHELKQPLSVMDMVAQNMVETLKEEELSADELRDYALSKAERVAANVVRLRTIIDHLRVFGRKVEGESQVFDARESVKAALLLIQHRFERSGVRLLLTQPDEAAPVDGHPILFEQVLLNLLNNAVDAMESLPHDLPREIRIEVVNEGAKLCLYVEDSAGGMPEAQLPRATEAYFTTKPAGKGTGLGLSISTDILKDMKGSLGLANGSSGLVATITLPLAEEAAAQESAPAA
ncbi:PAS domain S-box protein [Limibacillus halophilus]